MTEEPTNIDNVLRRVREELLQPQRGIVQEVFAHSASDDVSNHEVSVRLIDEDQARQRLPVASPADDVAMVPRGPDDPGGPDDVLVQFLDGDAQRGIVTHILPTLESRAPEATAGDIRAKRGDLYLELAGDGSSARLARKPGDRDPPTAAVSVDDAGNIAIETDGDISVSAGGDIVIDEGGTAKAVATEDHTHTFSYDGGGKNSSQLSGTTAGPDDVTSTEVE